MYQNKLLMYSQAFAKAIPFFDYPYYTLLIIEKIYRDLVMKQGMWDICRHTAAYIHFFSVR